MAYFSDHVIAYYTRLKPPNIKLPKGVSFLNPFSQKETILCIEKFYKKFYHDSHPRKYIFGINPGRFGAGITGVPFTDPLRLQKVCGIENTFQKKSELSSIFVYELIATYGGVRKFYQDFYISAVCPLGFIKDGKNWNYYDSPTLMKVLESYLAEEIKKQLMWGALEPAFCLGKGKNFHYFSKLNEKYDFFKQVYPLPHPRWVMQYRLKSKLGIIDQFMQTFSKQE